MLSLCCGCLTDNSELISVVLTLANIYPRCTVCNLNCHIFFSFSQGGECA